MPRSISTLTERPGRALLLLALLFAVIAAVLVFVALNQNDDDDKEAPPRPPPRSSSPPMISTPAPPSRASMLEVADVPTDSVLDGAFSDVDDLDEQVTRYPLISGEQVIASKIGVPEEDDGGAVVCRARGDARLLDRGVGGERRGRPLSARRPGGRHRYPRCGSWSASTSR